MSINERLLTASYFKDVQIGNESVKKEIPLQYEVTFPEYVCVGCLSKPFSMFLDSNRKFFALNALDKVQAFFQKCVVDRHRTYKYSPGEPDLRRVIEGLYKKTLVQMDFELDLLSNEAVKAAELKIQKMAEEQSKVMQEIVLTRKQVDHLLALYKDIRDEEKGIPLNAGLYKIAVISI